MCVSIWQRVTVLFDKRNFEQVKLGQYQGITIVISKSCSCKKFQESGYNFMMQLYTLQKHVHFSAMI